MDQEAHGAELGVRMFACSSSQIAAYGYDPAATTMRVEFRAGPTWDYLGVPEDVFAQFLWSRSKGKFLHHQVKPNFKAEKVE